jgi:hypothetical protein
VALCAFDAVAFDDVAFDVCAIALTPVSGGGLAIPLRRKKRKHLDDELAVILHSQHIAQTLWREDKD